LIERKGHVRYLEKFHDQEKKYNEKQDDILTKESEKAR
jgi:hypothetical protein